MANSTSDIDPLLEALKQAEAPKLQRRFESDHYPAHVDYDLSGYFSDYQRLVFAFPASEFQHGAKGMFDVKPGTPSAVLVQFVHKLAHDLHVAYLAAARQIYQDEVKAAQAELRRLQFESRQQQQQPRGRKRRRGRKEGEEEDGDEEEGAHAEAGMHAGAGAGAEGREKLNPFEFLSVAQKEAVARANDFKSRTPVYVYYEVVFSEELVDAGDVEATASALRVLARDPSKLICIRLWVMYLDIRLLERDPVLLSERLNSCGILHKVLTSYLRGTGSEEAEASYRQNARASFKAKAEPAPFPLITTATQLSAMCTRYNKVLDSGVLHDNICNKRNYDLKRQPNILTTFDLRYALQIGVNARGNRNHAQFDIGKYGVKEQTGEDADQYTFHAFGKYDMRERYDGHGHFPIPACVWRIELDEFRLETWNSYVFPHIQCLLEQNMPTNDEVMAEFDNGIDVIHATAQRANTVRATAGKCSRDDINSFLELRALGKLAITKDPADTAIINRVLSDVRLGLFSRMSNVSGEIHVEGLRHTFDFMRSYTTKKVTEFGLQMVQLKKHMIDAAQAGIVAKVNAWYAKACEAEGGEENWRGAGVARRTITAQWMQDAEYEALARFRKAYADNIQSQQNEFFTWWQSVLDNPADMSTAQLAVIAYLKKRLQEKRLNGEVANLCHPRELEWANLSAFGNLVATEALEAKYVHGIIHQYRWFITMIIAHLYTYSGVPFKINFLGIGPQATGKSIQCQRVMALWISGTYAIIASITDKGFLANGCNKNDFTLVMEEVLMSAFAIGDGTPGSMQRNESSALATFLKAAATAGCLIQVENAESTDANGRRVRISKVAVSQLNLCWVILGNIENIERMSQPMLSRFMLARYPQFSSADVAKSSVTRSSALQKTQGPTITRCRDVECIFWHVAKLIWCRVIEVDLSIVEHVFSAVLERMKNDGMVTNEMRSADRVLKVAWQRTVHAAVVKLWHYLTTLKDVEHDHRHFLYVEPFLCATLEIAYWSIAFCAHQYESPSLYRVIDGLKRYLDSMPEPVGFLTYDDWSAQAPIQAEYEAIDKQIKALDAERTDCVGKSNDAHKIVQKVHNELREKRVIVDFDACNGADPAYAEAKRAYDLATKRRDDIDKEVKQKLGPARDAKKKELEATPCLKIVDTSRKWLFLLPPESAIEKQVVPPAGEGDGGDPTGESLPKSNKRARGQKQKERHYPASKDAIGTLAEAICSSLPVDQSGDEDDRLSYEEVYKGLRDLAHPDRLVPTKPDQQKANGMTHVRAFEVINSRHEFRIATSLLEENTRSRVIRALNQVVQHKHYEPGATLVSGVSEEHRAWIYKTWRPGPNPDAGDFQFHNPDALPKEAACLSRSWAYHQQAHVKVDPLLSGARVFEVHAEYVDNDKDFEEFRRHEQDVAKNTKSVIDSALHVKGTATIHKHPDEEFLIRFLERRGWIYNESKTHEVVWNDSKLRNAGLPCLKELVDEATFRSARFKHADAAKSYPPPVEGGVDALARTRPRRHPSISSRGGGGKHDVARTQQPAASPTASTSSSDSRMDIDDKTTEASLVSASEWGFMNHSAASAAAAATAAEAAKNARPVRDIFHELMEKGRSSSSSTTTVSLRPPTAASASHAAARISSDRPAGTRVGVGSGPHRLSATHTNENSLAGNNNADDDDY